MENSSSALNILYSLFPEIKDVSSNDIIDYEPSKKYRITFKQARIRALKTIKRIKKWQVV